jgi:lipoic acid synthetase
MQPTKKQLEVEKYYTPDEFLVLKEMALERGFLKIESGPFVRSSYHAEENFFSSQIIL